jgi:hypothetical protein
MAGVANDVPDHARMLGAPAIPEREQKLQFAALSKLPEMRKAIKLLQRQVAELGGETATETAALSGLGIDGVVPEPTPANRAA